MAHQKKLRGLRNIRWMAGKQSVCKTNSWSLFSSVQKCSTCCAASSQQTCVFSVAKNYYCYYWHTHTYARVYMCVSIAICKEKHRNHPIFVIFAIFRHLWLETICNNIFPTMGQSNREQRLIFEYAATSLSLPTALTLFVTISSPAATNQFSSVLFVVFFVRCVGCSFFRGFRNLE